MNHSDNSSNNSSAFMVITTDRVVLCSILIFLTVLTVLGNFSVFAAVYTSAQIRRRNTTILVCNLAAADFLVGMFVMPLGVVQTLTGGVWMFSISTCRLWASLDVISCTASIATLVLISLERFVGVTRPLKYTFLVSRRNLFYGIFFVWLYSLIVLLATLKWDNMSETRTACSVGDELQFVFTSVVFSFFLPLIVILLVYFRIFYVLRRRTNSMLKAAPILPADARRDSTESVRRARTNRKSMRKGLLQTKAYNHPESMLRMHYGGEKTNGVNPQQSERVFLNKQRKVSKTLGIVVAAFLICWSPFFLLYSLTYVCSSCNVPAIYLEAFSWLGYGNSALNPVIYALSMRTFANTLRRLFGGVFCMRKSFFNASGDSSMNAVSITTYKDSRRNSAQPCYVNHRVLVRSSTLSDKKL